MTKNYIKANLYTQNFNMDFLQRIFKYSHLDYPHSRFFEEHLKFKLDSSCLEPFYLQLAHGIY